MMVNSSEAKLENVCIHLVGNKTNGILSLSKQPIAVDDNILHLLSGFFLKPFKESAFYHLSDKEGEFSQIITGIFKEPSTIQMASIRLAKILFEHSVNPAIKTGEFFVAYFRDCLVEDEIVDAIGLFKSENKETYLKVFPDNEVFQVAEDEGININKLDKGAIIYNTESDKGFLINMVDRTNNLEAKYWSEGFLNLRAREDDYHHTHNYLQMCRDFAMEELETDNRGQKVGLVKDAVNYFKEHNHFDSGDFASQVIREPEIIEAFEDYSKNYELKKHLNTVDDFDISRQAVRHSGRFIRSVIKLDRNFHIYVHGKRDWIKRGFDEQKGLHYYQVFFEEES